MYKVEEKVYVIDPLSIGYFTDKEKLRRDNNRQISKKIASSDHLSYDLIFIPVHSETIKKALDIKPDLLNHGHWSIMVYFTRRNIILHYDSIRGCNAEYAATLVALLFKHTDGFIKKNTRLFDEEGLIPDQDSDWQCGYIVTQVCKRIIERACFNYNSKIRSGITCNIVFDDLLEKQISTTDGSISSEIYCVNYKEKIIKFLEMESSKEYFPDKNLPSDPRNGVKGISIGKKLTNLKRKGKPIRLN
jgi:hypothetical protein